MVLASLLKSQILSDKLFILQEWMVLNTKDENMALLIPRDALFNLNILQQGHGVQMLQSLHLFQTDPVQEEQRNGLKEWFVIH